VSPSNNRQAKKQSISIDLHLIKQDKQPIQSNSLEINPTAWIIQSVENWAIRPHEKINKLFNSRSIIHSNQSKGWWRGPLMEKRSRIQNFSIT
jgi:hypothetical protein